MKTILTCAFMFLSTTASTQGLTARATGVDGGGTSGKIISFESNSTLRSIRVKANQRSIGLDAGTNTRNSIKIPSISIDLNTVSEITLKDGTVLRKNEVVDMLRNKL
jgi:hypothetical protein